MKTILHEDQILCHDYHPHYSAWRNMALLAVLICFVQCRGVIDSNELINSNSIAPLKLAYVQYDTNGDTNIYLLTEGATAPIRLTTAPTIDTGPVWSPDGEQIAFTSDRGHPEGEYDIYLMNADGTNQISLTTAPGNDVHPVWSPDGSKIAFLSERDGFRRVYTMNADGTDQKLLLYDSAISPSWSPDGTQLALEMEKHGGYGIYSVKADGSKLRRLSVPAPTYDLAPTWSPRGDRIIYESVLGQIRQIYVVSPDGRHRARLTPIPWASHPVLSPDGERVAFLGPGGIFVINVDGTQFVPLVQTDETGTHLCWSPDSNALIISYERRLHRLQLKSGQLEPLTPENVFAFGPSWASR